MSRGKFYEAKALEYLKLKGYKILETNFCTRWGEIDIIANDGNFVALVEVKARKTNSLICARQALDRRKQSKLELAAKVYSQGNPDLNYRFDVVAIEDCGDCLKYELIKDAFYLGQRR